MSSFTIKDLELLSGIKAHTIRIWEQRYHFLRPQRTTTNIRYYSCDELKKLLDIALLNKYGHKISQIDKMDAGEIREKIMELSVEERIVNKLVQEMAAMDINGFEKIINEYTEQHGIDKTITAVIFPFFEKTGIMWENGNIQPAQEQLVINCIRQKIVVAIETINKPALKTELNLLFLPEGVYDELGLLYIHWLLKSKGERTIYLGANVPFHDVEEIVRSKKPDRIFIHLSKHYKEISFENLIKDLRKRLTSTITIISGKPAQDHQKNTGDLIHLKSSFTELQHFISALN